MLGMFQIFSWGVRVDLRVDRILVLSRGGGCGGLAGLVTTVSGVLYREDVGLVSV
jgi:hypothetical protein